jgi:hypothetical protein
MVFSEVAEESIAGVASLWISEWDYAFDQKTNLDPNSETRTLGKKEIEPIIKSLMGYEPELAKYGVHVISISDKRADQVVHLIRKGRSENELPRMTVSYNQWNKATRPISIVFLHGSRVIPRPDQIEKVLGKSFRVIRESDFESSSG